MFCSSGYTLGSADVAMEGTEPTPNVRRPAGPPHPPSLLLSSPFPQKKEKFRFLSGNLASRFTLQVLFGSSML